jgi:amidase
MALALEQEAAVAAGGELPPFHGVPIGIKDLYDVKGMRTTSSHSAFRSFVADADTIQVQRFKRAGFNIVGKTNVPELGAAVTTESALNGPCHNPWDLDRSSGGSSGGAAAAVAAGLLPIGHASDGGGSIRIPAACCGLVGLKPSRGRVSLGPGPGSILEGAVTQGVVTRTVADTAALLDVMHGYETGEPFLVPPPEQPFLELSARPPNRLRIALCLDSPTGSQLHPDVSTAIRRAAQLLDELGHDVVEASPTWIDDEFVALQRRFYSTQFGFAEISMQDLEPENQLWYREAESLSSLDFMRCWVRIQAYLRRAMAFWDDYDLVLTPTLGAPPKLLGERLDHHPSDLPLWGFYDYIPFLTIANLTGQPAITVPVAWSQHELPIGVQLIGQPAGEADLLRVARQMEDADPWRDRYDGLAARLLEVTG